MASIQELIYKQKVNMALVPGAATGEAAGVEVWSTTAKALLVSDGTNWRYAGAGASFAEYALAGIA